MSSLRNRKAALAERKLAKQITPPRAVCCDKLAESLSTDDHTIAMVAAWAGMISY